MTESRFFNDSVRRVLLVRLRSIGDTVLLSPCLQALKDWRADIEIDVLLESLSAPVLTAHPHISRLFVLPKLAGSWAKFSARWQMVRALRARRYDLAINLHGGTTATFLTGLAGARVSIGYQANQYSWLLSGRAPSPTEIWQKSQIHCVEQQLALLKWAGVPVTSPPPLSLSVDPAIEPQLLTRLTEAGLRDNFVVIHPSAAFASKQWEAARFARAIEHLQRFLPVVVAVAPAEAGVVSAIRAATNCDFVSFTDLTLAELMVLISRCRLFLGNDSGPAHIAAAFGKPLAVIFGSSNWQVWHPWSQAPYRLLRTEMPCAPCPGYHCSEFPEPECIKRISVDQVTVALDELLALT